MHPGIFLKRQLMIPRGLSTRALAALISMPKEQVLAFTCGETDVTIELAVALGAYFDMSPNFWLDAQLDFNAWKRGTADRFRIPPINIMQSSISKISAAEFGK